MSYNFKLPVRELRIVRKWRIEIDKALINIKDIIKTVIKLNEILRMANLTLA
jgi:hypothetical protein